MCYHAHNSVVGQLTGATRGGKIMTTEKPFWNRYNLFASLILTLTLSFYGGKSLQFGDGFGVFIILLVVAPHVLRLRRTNWRLPLFFLTGVLIAAATGYTLA